jgi:hypothetical protein
MARVRSPCYERHRPEDTVLYRTLERHLEPFLACASDQGGGDGLPAFVTRELRANLRCGRLEHGCVHVRCEQCGDEMVVAFSCKGRGFCPSCGGRRMSELAAQLVDGVIPRMPVRQWVLSLPFTLRDQLAFDAPLTGAVLDVFIRSVFAGLRRAAIRAGSADAQAVALDMWEPYVQSVQAHVPQAARRIVFDPLHIIQHMNGAVDQVRRHEHRLLRAQGDETLTGSKYLASRRAPGGSLLSSMRPRSGFCVPRFVPDSDPTLVLRGHSGRASVASVDDVHFRHCSLGRGLNGL